MTELILIALGIAVVAIWSKLSQLHIRIVTMERRSDIHATRIKSLSDEWHRANSNANEAPKTAAADGNAEAVTPPEEDRKAAAVPPAQKPADPEPDYGHPKVVAEQTAKDPAQKQAVNETKPLMVKKANPTNAFDEMEGDLSSKWLIWIGGIALALGGGFLVKYSIDANLLRPVVRVALGVLFGLLLTVGGEVVRRKRSEIEWFKEQPDYLPSAISAAGLFTLFASIYGAYGLYELLSPTFAFALLAIVSLAASFLATLHGKFFAYVGMVGGMVVPAMVSTGNGEAWALFPYLLLVVAATLTVARRHAWTDVAASTLATASLWVVLWMFTNWHAGDVLPVGLYLLVLGGLNTILLRGASPERSTEPSLFGMMPSHVVSVMSDGVTLLTLVLLASIVRLDHYGALSLILFTTGLAAQAYAMTRDAEHDTGALAALGASLFLLATWHVPDLFELQQRLGSNEAMHFALAPIAAPGFEKFATASILLAGFVGFGVFALLPSLLRKPMWASVAVGYPVLVLIIAYGRLNEFETNVPFAAIAAGMAGLFTLAVAQLNKTTPAGMRAPIAAYAAGATAAIALALTMILRDAWLSFALALEIVALGYIWQKTRVNGLRTLALGMASIVLVRLFLNASIFGYGGEDMPIINWLFYGYGLTAGLFVYGARLFNHADHEDMLVSVLKAGAAILLVSFITLEQRVIFSGHLLGEFSAAEAALQTVNWTAASTILFWRETRDGNALFGLLRRVMTFVSLFGLIAFGGLFNNILFSRVEVGSWPLFNLLLLQFFVPGLLYALKAHIAGGAGKDRSQMLYGFVAFAIFFFWITLEVRHLFHPTGGSAAVTDWEWYSYSLAWLMYAVALLVAGIRLEIRRVRMAGLALVGVVILKVFMFDMSALEGIARAVSFMGLGASLIGMGYLYQFFRREDAERADPADPTMGSD